jgi:hypothetical protein
MYNLKNLLGQNMLVVIRIILVSLIPLLETQKWLVHIAAHTIYDLFGLK